MTSQVIVDGRDSSTASETTWSQSCVEKWTRAKNELKVKMENWKEQWRVAAAKWIDKITIETEIGEELMLATPLVIRFPPGKLFCFQNFTITIAPTAPTASRRKKTKTMMTANTIVDFDDGDENGGRGTTSGIVSVGYLMKHHQSIFQDDQNDWMPLNLFGDLIFHIVDSFGGKVKYTYPILSPVVCKNYLHFDRQHLFPGFSLQAGQSEAKDEQEVKEDEWTCVDYKTIVAGGKLVNFPDYRRELIGKLCAHQIRRLIDSHFGDFSNSTKFAKCNRKLLDSAYHFATSLKLDDGWVGRAFDSYLQISSSIFKIKVWFKTIDEIAKFSFYDQTDEQRRLQPTLERCVVTPIYHPDSKKITEMHGDLTNLNSRDLDSIVRIVLEVHFCGAQLRKIIDKSIPTPTSRFPQEFPSADDHFESFDEPAMRGLLTTTSVARKLATHAQNLELLDQNASESTHPIPAAVVDLMKSYLTPLL